MIDLYYYTSPNVRKVLMALEELGLAYEIKWTDIAAGKQFAAEYLKINPNGKVPAIIDHDGPGGRAAPNSTRPSAPHTGRRDHGGRARCPNASSTSCAWSQSCGSTSMNWPCC